MTIRRSERGRGCRSVKRRRWSRRCQTQTSARPRSLLPARPRLPVGSEPGGSLVKTTRGHLGPAWDHSGPPRAPEAPLPTLPPPRAPSAAGEAAGPARLGPSREADAGLSAPWDRPGRWGLGEGTRRGRGAPERKGDPGPSGAVETQTEFPRGTRRALRPLYGAVATTDLVGGQVARANLWRRSFFRLQVLKLESGYCGEETWRHQRRDRSGHARGGGEGIQNKSPAARLMIVNNVPSGSFNLLSPGVFNWSKAQFGRKGEFRLSRSPAWRR